MQTDDDDDDDDDYNDSGHSNLARRSDKVLPPTDG